MVLSQRASSKNSAIILQVHLFCRTKEKQGDYQDIYVPLHNEHEETSGGTVWSGK